MNDLMTFVCPNCKGKLFFNYEKGIESKNIKCPNCGYKAGYVVYLKYNTPPVSDEKGGQDNGPGTEVLPPIDKSKIGHLRELKTGKIHQLRQGTQIIGRYRVPPVADIVIGTPDDLDMYMSKKQACIEVNGNSVLLSDCGAPNPNVLDGADLDRKDKVYLSDGNVLTLGYTDLVYEVVDNGKTLTK